MKKYFSLLILICSGFVAFFLTACSAVDMDYVGRAYQPTMTVRYLELGDSYQRDDYVIFGRAFCTTKPNTSNEDIRNELLEIAREKGADAIKVTGTSSRDIAEFSIPKDVKGGSIYDPNIFQYDRGRDVGGDFLTTNSYGTNSKNLKDQRKVIVTEKILHVIFMKKIKDLKREKK